jgi:hypothetical protein
MLREIGSVCLVRLSRKAGDIICLGCLFHNDTYHEPKGMIYCVFPEKKSNEPEVIGSQLLVKNMVTITRNEEKR